MAECFISINDFFLDGLLQVVLVISVRFLDSRVSQPHMFVVVRVHSSNAVDVSILVIVVRHLHLDGALEAEAVRQLVNIQEAAKG